MVNILLLFCFIIFQNINQFLYVTSQFILENTIKNRKGFKNIQILELENNNNSNVDEKDFTNISTKFDVLFKKHSNVKVIIFFF